MCLGCCFERSGLALKQKTAISLLGDYIAIDVPSMYLQGVMRVMPIFRHYLSD